VAWLVKSSDDAGAIGDREQSEDEDEDEDEDGCVRSC
jgi:hypothetical protein